MWRGPVLYIDDGIMMVQGKEKADKQCSFVKESMKSAGLVVNEEKIFCWEPRQEVVWLHFKWCTSLGCILSQKSLATIHAGN